MAAPADMQRWLGPNDPATVDAMQRRKQFLQQKLPEMQAQGTQMASAAPMPGQPLTGSSPLGMAPGRPPMNFPGGSGPFVGPSGPFSASNAMSSPETVGVDFNGRPLGAMTSSQPPPAPPGDMDRPAYGVPPSYQEPQAAPAPPAPPTPPAPPAPTQTAAPPAPNEPPAPPSPAPAPAAPAPAPPAAPPPRQGPIVQQQSLGQQQNPMETAWNQMRQQTPPPRPVVQQAAPPPAPAPPAPPPPAPPPAQNLQAQAPASKPRPAVGAGSGNKGSVYRARQAAKAAKAEEAAKAAGQLKSSADIPGYDKAPGKLPEAFSSAQGNLAKMPKGLLTGAQSVLGASQSVPKKPAPPPRPRPGRPGSPRPMQSVAAAKVPEKLASVDRTSSASRSATKQVPPRPGSRAAQAARSPQPSSKVNSRALQSKRETGKPKQEQARKAMPKPGKADLPKNEGPRKVVDKETPRKKVDRRPPPRPRPGRERR